MGLQNQRNVIIDFIFASKLRLMKIVKIFCLAFLLGSLGCGSDCSLELIIPTSVNSQIALENEQEIVDYLTANNLVAQRTSNGLYYIIDDVGGAQKPDLCSSVTAIYRGYLTNGSEFDKSNSAGATFPLSNVILGWQEGIPFYGVGGKGMLFIPSKLAYGPNPPSSDIPPNAVLIFDVEVVDFQ